VKNPKCGYYEYGDDVVGVQHAKRASEENLKDMITGNAQKMERRIGRRQCGRE
jgi:hypothetical protein